MDLNVVELALGIHELEGVARVAVHVVVAVGSSTVREQGHDLVDRLGVLGEVVLGICAGQQLFVAGETLEDSPRTCQHP